MSRTRRDRAETGPGDLLASERFDRVVAMRMSRRDALRQAISAALVIHLPILGNKRWVPRPSAPGAPVFAPVPPDSGDAVRVPAGYRSEPLLRWGEPLLPGAPAFDPRRQSAAAQAMQFGYNCDFVYLLPLPKGSPDPTRGLLVVNHEYTNPELMFEGWDPERPDREQVDIQLEAHGMSLVEVYCDLAGRWRKVEGSRHHRRITGTSPILLSGPVAGHPYVRTREDPSGRLVQGMLGNCSGDITPWGTILSAEENFHLYFGDRDRMDKRNDPRWGLMVRYGFPRDGSSYGFERAHDRFRLGVEPNEAFRFGYVVEIDPYDPGWTPRKRTAMGRFRREGATCAVAPDGRVAFYSGDDIIFEHVYKFVSRDAWRPNDRAHNRELLDHGTLYAARFEPDGSGRWLPLVQGQGPLQPERGFNDQADVILNTIEAAQAMGATRMDRPEDIAVHPSSRKVYISLTKNPDRGNSPLPGTGKDAANPRSLNHNGHIIELEEEGGDAAATRFRWNIFMLCGDPDDPSTYFAGYPRSGVSAVACPDNLRFDPAGNLWVATDGQPGTLGMNDGLYAVPVEGPERGRIQRFLTGVPGAEITGTCFNRTATTLFVAIQHPGEGGSLEAPISRWPDGDLPPRPSVIAVQAEDGRRIGAALADGPAP